MMTMSLPERKTIKITAIRVAWLIDGVHGHGYWMHVSDRPQLQQMVDDGNIRYGSASHWIEERCDS